MTADQRARKVLLQARLDSCDPFGDRCKDTTALLAITRALSSAEAVREAAAKVVDDELESRRAEQKRDLFDNFLRGQINSALRMAAAIRAMPLPEPPGAAFERGGE